MTARAKKETAADPEQSARFIEAARELGCDESPDAFEAAVKKMARHKPVEENCEITFHHQVVAATQ